MKYRYLHILIAISLCLSCDDSSNEESDDVLNESSLYSVCNNIVVDCRNGNGDYCLNGFKWGETNPILRRGENATGPQEAGGVITYSFQEENGLVNTHAQINLPSNSFDNLASCAKDEIRKAFTDWSAVANIDFEEQEDNSLSDIKIYVADIRQSGVGYPNFSEDPCNSTMAGNFVIQTDTWTEDCDVLYLFFLHEIGHVLGLGHVGSNNIMAADFDIIGSLDGIQEGDAEGLVQLYGSR